MLLTILKLYNLSTSSLESFNLKLYDFRQPSSCVSHMMLRSPCWHQPPSWGHGASSYVNFRIISIAFICCTKHVVVFTAIFHEHTPSFFHLIASISHIRSPQIKMVENKEMFPARKLCSLYSPTEVSAHLLRAVWNWCFWAIQSLALMSALLWSHRKSAPEEFTLST